MRVSVIRKGIFNTVTAEDRVLLDTIIRNRNSPQKHVWRARIIVLTADGEGTTAITRAVGKGKTVVWPGVEACFGFRWAATSTRRRSPTQSYSSACPASAA